MHIAGAEPGGGSQSVAGFAQSLIEQNASLMSAQKLLLLQT